MGFLFGLRGLPLRNLLGTTCSKSNHWLLSNMLRTFTLKDWRVFHILTQGSLLDNCHWSVLITLNSILTLRGSWLVKCFRSSCLENRFLIRLLIYISWRDLTNRSTYILLCLILSKQIIGWAALLFLARYFFVLRIRAFIKIPLNI